MRSSGRAFASSLLLSRIGLVHGVRNGTGVLLATCTSGTGHRHPCDVLDTVGVLVISYLVGRLEVLDGRLRVLVFHRGVGPVPVTLLTDLDVNNIGEGLYYEAAYRTLEFHRSRLLGFAWLYGRTNAVRPPESAFNGIVFGFGNVLYSLRLLIGLEFGMAQRTEGVGAFDFVCWGNKRRTTVSTMSPSILVGGTPFVLTRLTDGVSWVIGLGTPHRAYVVIRGLFCRLAQLVPAITTVAYLFGVVRSPQSTLHTYLFQIAFSVAGYVVPFMFSTLPALVARLWGVFLVIERAIITV